MVVLRKNGSVGSVGVKWKIIDVTTTLGVDYLGSQGGIQFRPGEVRVIILKKYLVNYLLSLKNTLKPLHFFKFYYAKMFIYMQVVFKF